VLVVLFAACIDTHTDARQVPVDEGAEKKFRKFENAFLPKTELLLAT
jgi:hypothetical protein